jgi:hypothetical protein
MSKSLIRSLLARATMIVSTYGSLSTRSSLSSAIQLYSDEPVVQPLPSSLGGRTLEYSSGAHKTDLFRILHYAGLVGLVPDSPRCARIVVVSNPIIVRRTGHRVDVGILWWSPDKQTGTNEEANTTTASCLSRVRPETVSTWCIYSDERLGWLVVVGCEGSTRDLVL